MSNSTASFLFNLSYIGPSSEAVTMPQQSVNSLYQAQNEGIIDVPDTTASATSFPVPFGGITTDATGGIIQNRTGQNLTVKINGAASASHSIPHGGIFCWANPSTASTPITSLALITTAIQSGSGQIAYRLFGDPV